MKLGWYIRRLRSMEPAEVLHRLSEAALKRASRGRHEGWVRYPAAELTAPFPEWPARIRNASTAQRAAIRDAVLGLRQGKFAALGREWPVRDAADLFPSSLWRLDPVTGGEWSADEYCFDIDVRGGTSRGDVKYVWEINRLQFLPVLAAHALLENDSGSIEAVEDAIASWHRANPPFRGVAWASGIEVALRAVSLIATLSIIGDRLATETQRRVASTLNAGAFWLGRFPSRFSSANNHRVAELAGEFLIALALGRDVSPARRELARQVELQILADGTPAEQSPTYGAFTAELALLCIDAARQAGAPFEPTVDQRLATFATFADWIGSGRFGDDDEGRAITAGPEPDYPGSVASSISGLLGRAGGQTGDADFRGLIFGSPTQAAPAPTGLKSFANGGLSVWRGAMSGREVSLTLDHGPLGYLSIAAHGHADALSITMSIDGRPVLVDPGTYLYGSGGAWRDWFRSTPAHNTLSIAGESQSTMAGSFNWSRKANSRLIESRPEPHWQLRAAHDGYRHRFGVMHERIVVRDTDAIEIDDRLQGASAEAEIVFQLAFGLVVERNGRDAVISDAGQRLLTIRPPEGTFDIKNGTEENMAGGWVSPSFGVKVPAPRLVWRGHVGGDGVVTRLSVMPPR